MQFLMELLVVCLVTCAMLWTMLIGLDKQINIEREYLDKYLSEVQHDSK